MEDSGTTSGGYTYLLHDVSIECHHCHVSNAHERLKAFSIITRPRYSLYPTGHIGLSSHTHTYTRSKYLPSHLLASLYPHGYLSDYPQGYKKGRVLVG